MCAQLHLKGRHKVVPQSLVKPIKLRAKGGQPTMPCDASWLAAVRNLL